MQTVNVNEPQIKTTIQYFQKELIEKSKIYGREGRKCTRYEDMVNKAAFELCVDNGSLISDRKVLYQKARSKVDADGYNYKKGASRSKTFGDQSEVERPIKKVKLESEIRQKRISEVSEDISSCQETISLLEQQRSKFVTVGKYLQAAEIVKQVSESRKKMRDLQAELAQLQKKETRSQKYHKTKKEKQSQSQSTSKSTLETFFRSKTVTNANSSANCNTRSVVCKTNSYQASDPLAQNTTKETERRQSPPESSVSTLTCTGESSSKVVCTKDSQAEVYNESVVRKTFNQVSEASAENVDKEVQCFDETSVLDDTCTSDLENMARKAPDLQGCAKNDQDFR